MENKSRSLNSLGWNRVLFVVLFLSLVLIFGILLYNFNRTYQNARSDVIELSISSSSQNAEAMELFFVRHEDVLLATAEMVEYTLGSRTAGIDDVEKLLHNMSVAYNDSIYQKATGKDFTGIYAAVGGVLVHGLKTSDDLPEGYDPLQRQWYKEGAAGGGKVVFGEPYFDVYDPSILVMTATKLLSDGKTVVGMDITLEDMQFAGGNMDVSVTLNGERHNYGRGMILTDRGVVMAHWDSSEQGKNYGEPRCAQYAVFQKIKECADSDEAYLEMDIDGVNYGIFPQKLSNGWYVVTMTDLQEIRTAISDFSKLLLTGTATVILMGAVYCFLILRAYRKAKKLTEKLQGALELATVDSLTNLGNRTAYDMRIKELQEQLDTRNDAPFALIMMDLNDLKYINDNYGHAAGDQYIRNCCQLVREVFPGEIFRIGGDEFAIFLTGDAFALWEDIFDGLQQRVAEANLKIEPDVDQPSIAIGMTLHHKGSPDDMDALLRKADAEMYAHKVAIKQKRLEQSEKGLTSDLSLKLRERQILASEMRKGLAEEQFEVWFQPQVNHENNGSLIGAEALVRWRHPERGMVSPALFIPLLEYNGLIYELDKYVWKHTCRYIRRWIDEGMEPLPISVNVSRMDIIQDDFLETISALAKDYRIPYELLHLEVTESAFSDDTGKVVAVVKELIRRGFTIAIDDFGSGYSSLSLLRNVPAHIVKLDMRFFADGEEKARNECIVESIIRMVKMLGMGVLAEGVEQREQADRLNMLGCAYVQGYLYAKPLPYQEYVKYTKATVKEILSRNDGRVQVEEQSESLLSQTLFHNIISGTNDVIIVADHETRQLLYANRAAEEFFGKRFDPLTPTTCMQYCEKGEICNNCPARDMKPGEKREFVTADSGRHIKSLYTQMDWNGHDAVVIYQTDISAEMREMEYANSLMNSLGVGIVVFHGETPDELVPVFCNKEYLLLSGLREDEYKTVLRKSSLYGIHPDDIDGARKKFAETYRSGHPMQSYLRVMKKKGGYEWVSVYAKVRQAEAGGFDVYMIFSDAEEEMQKRTMEAERYERHIIQISKNAAESLSVIHLNLTQNTCRSIHRDRAVNRPATFQNGVEGFLSSVVQNIAQEELKAEFTSRFSVSALKEDFECGRFTDEMRLPIRLVDQRIVWCNQTVNISRNPNTGDLEAVMSLKEDDKDIRLAEHYKRLIQYAYEFVGAIDVETGLLTVISEPKARGLAQIGEGAAPYMENLEPRMHTLVEQEYVAACIEALRFHTIRKKLGEQTSYTCTFPAKASLTGHVGAFQWHFVYVNESKSEILFTRRELREYHFS